jgi:hypothetical protein
MAAAIFWVTLKLTDTARAGFCAAFNQEAYLKSLLAAKHRYFNLLILQALVSFYCTLKVDFAATLAVRYWQIKYTNRFVYQRLKLAIVVQI